MTVMVATMADNASLIAAIASLVTGVGLLISSIAVLRGQRQSHEKLDDVAAKVETVNGLTLGTLAERQEGRAIVEHVPETERTPGQQVYVDRLALEPDDDA